MMGIVCARALSDLHLSCRWPARTHSPPTEYTTWGVGVGTPVMRGTPPLSLAMTPLSPSSFDCLRLSGRALHQSPHWRRFRTAQRNTVSQLAQFKGSIAGCGVTYATQSAQFTPLLKVHVCPVSDGEGCASQ